MPSPPTLWVGRLGFKWVAWSNKPEACWDNASRRLTLLPGGGSAEKRPDRNRSCFFLEQSSPWWGIISVKLNKL